MKLILDLKVARSQIVLKIFVELSFKAVLLITNEYNSLSNKKLNGRRLFRIYRQIGYISVIL